MLYDLTNVYGRQEMSNFSLCGESAALLLFLPGKHCHITSICVQPEPLPVAFLCRDLEMGIRLYFYIYCHFIVQSNLLTAISGDSPLRIAVKPLHMEWWQVT